MILHVIILLNFIIAPAGEVRGCVINSEEPIRAYERNSVTEDRSSYSIRGATPMAYQSCEYKNLSE
jgi:hypothetical protein